MKKIKRELKNIIEAIKSIRISTIYKLVGIFLLFIILFWVYKTVNKSEKITEKQSIILTGTIVNKGKDYIIIKDMSQNEYLIHGVEEEKYPIGSDVNATVESVVESGNEEKPTTITSSGINITKENTKNKNADEEVIAYLNETETYFENVSLHEEIKVRFITIVDFLFYNGEIKGYTLNDLTSQTKLQVLKIALSIDYKIEMYLPGYKESITSTSEKIYTGIKNKILEMYLTTTTKICNYDQNLCESAKIDFQEIKQTFSITWNVIRNLISSSTENLKEWYEIWSGKSS